MSPHVDGMKSFDEPTTSIDESTKEINFDTEENSKIALISASVSEEEEAVIVAVLREFPFGFALSYEYMSGLDPSLVEHRLVLKPDVKSVKQKL